MNRYSIVLIAIVSLVVSCRKPTETRAEKWDSTTFYFDWNAMASVLVERMAIQPGEKVLLVGRPGRFSPFVAVLRSWIEDDRGEFLGAISVDTTETPEGWETDFTRAALGNSLDGLVERFKAVDVAIMLPGAAVTDRPYEAMQQVLRSGHGRTVHFHWAGAYSLSGTLLDITPGIDREYQNAVLSTDYSRLQKVHEFFEKAARDRNIHVTTPQGTDLTFYLGNRPVTRQDGDASMQRTKNARNLIDREVEIPAGAIRVAPIEESVEGRIAFPDAIWSGENVKGLVLTFKAGRIVHMNAAAGLDAVREELQAAGAAGYAFREFALGFNPLLAIPPKGERWIPYYGYGSGVVRLSLGDNTELGGNVGGGYVRWNFFTNATVTLGEAVIVRDGVMLQ